MRPSVVGETAFSVYVEVFAALALFAGLWRAGVSLRRAQAAQTWPEP